MITSSTRRPNGLRGGASRPATKRAGREGALPSSAVLMVQLELAAGVIPIVQQVTRTEDRRESKGRTGLVGNRGNA